MIIKGVGRFMARKMVNGVPTSEVIDCGRLQSLRFTFNVEMEDIFGGDGLFAFDQLLKNKSIEVVATDAQFDLNMMALAMGGSVSELSESSTGNIWTLGEQKTAKIVSPATAPTITLSGKVATGGGITVKEFSTNKLYASGATAAAGTYEIDNSGEATVLTFVAADAGKDFIINYEKEINVGSVYDMFINDTPFPVTVVHQGVFTQKDGTKQGIQIELYSCIASGSVTIDESRRTASAHEVTLKLIDPERADGKVGRITRFTGNVASV